MTPWKIFLFGALEIQKSDGSVLRFGGKKAGELLAQLALYPDRAHTREALADLLWPESDAVNGRTRLRQELAALRSLLQTEEDATSLLRISRNDVQLRGDLAWSDTARFRATLQEAGQSDHPEQAERLLVEAVSLYRADLLTEYTEFTSERLDFTHRHQQACRELAALQAKRADTQSAEETLKHLLARDPLLEEAHVDLMRLYATLGQPTKIRRQYQELERALRQVLNAHPSATTRALMEELLQSAVAPPRSQAELPEALPPIVPDMAPLPSTTHSPGEPVRNGAQSDNGHSPARSPAATPTSGGVRPPRQIFARSRLRVAAALCVALLCLMLFLVGRRNLHPRPTAPKPPPIQYGTEQWVYYYEPLPGKKSDSQANAMTVDAQNDVYITGQIQTAKIGKDKEEPISSALRQAGQSAVSIHVSAR